MNNLERTKPPGFMLGALLGVSISVAMAGCATSLCSAAASDDVARAKTLLSNGSRTDERCTAGWSPLHYAAAYGGTKVAALLIEKGADVNARDYPGDTPLHLAADQGQVQMVALLLKAGADPTIAAGGKTPLGVAEYKGQTTIVKILRDAEERTVRGIAQPPSGTEPAPASPPVSLHATALVMELKTVGALPANLANQVTKMILARLDDVKGLRTVSPEDVQLMLSVEKQKDAMGCDDVRCMAEIGGALGTDIVIYGQIGVVGTQYSLSLTAIDSKRTLAVGRVSALVDASEDTLIKSVPGAVASLLAKIARD